MDRELWRNNNKKHSHQTKGCTLMSEGVPIPARRSNKTIIIKTAIDTRIWSAIDHEMQICAQVPCPVRVFLGNCKWSVHTRHTAYHKVLLTSCDSLFREALAKYLRLLVILLGEWLQKIDQNQLLPGLYSDSNLQQYWRFVISPLLMKTRQIKTQYISWSPCRRLNVWSEWVRSSSWWTEDWACGINWANVIKWHVGRSRKIQLRPIKSSRACFAEPPFLLRKFD